MDGLNQVSYIFIPFSVPGRKAWAELVDSLRKSPDWVDREIPNKYFLRYIAEKANPSLPGCACYHFRIRPEALRSALYPAAASGHPKNDWLESKLFSFCITAPDKTTFCFRIQDVLLYSFSTGVSLLAFQVVFASGEPLEISTGLFHLKRVSTQLFVPRSAPGCGTTLLNLAKRLIAASAADEEKYCFFDYAMPGQARANVFTFVDVPDTQTFDRDLYYLRHCYDTTYEYDPALAANTGDTLYTSRCCAWGITSEAVACMVCSQACSDDFLRKRFFQNIKADYLFMNVWLLHQKYVLYMLLSSIGMSESNDLASLEDFQQQLYAFKTDFVFTHVTEVPQYQTLYDRIYKAYSLEELFRDVQDPVQHLKQLRQAADEAAQKRSRFFINSLLFYLSVFTSVTTAWSNWERVKGAFTQSIYGPLIAGGVLALILLPLLYERGRKLFRKHRKLRRFAPQHTAADTGTTNTRQEDPHMRSTSAPDTEPGSGDGKKYIYTACFVDPQELAEKTKAIPGQKSLARVIPCPHVTVFFNPEATYPELFGEKVRITIDGYGSDGRNEGVHVTLQAKEPELTAILNTIEVAHITLSVSPEGRPKDTGRLVFRPIPQPITLEGTYGGMPCS